MFITKSEELHMELEAAKVECLAAIKEARIGLVSHAYALAAVRVWDDALDLWEDYNTRPKVSLRRKCIGRACQTSARHWVAGRYDVETAEGFAACRKHADTKAAAMGAHFLIGRDQFMDEMREVPDHLIAGNCPQDGGEY
jgi:hypothetical protein